MLLGQVQKSHDAVHYIIIIIILYCTTHSVCSKKYCNIFYLKQYNIIYIVCL